MKTSAYKFPQGGTDPGELFREIEENRKMDFGWEEGRMFGFVYYPGSKITETLEEVHKIYLHDNALNPTTFSSLRKMENELVAMAGELLHGDKRTCGSVTTGGTESILMAMKVARDWKNEHKPGIIPEVIVPVSAHPAFDKAAHYLGIKLLHAPLRSDFRVDVQGMASLITDRTAMLVGSAPCFPYGVVDPIPEIAQLARKSKLLCHVDACMGGFMLPFLEEMGSAITPFDFRVKGVTSMSADLHKNGYSLKGASLVLYRDPELRKRQFFITTEWPGGIFASSSLLGSKSGGPAASAWAMVKLMGREGYKDLAAKVMDTTRKMQAGITKIEGLHIVSNPEMSVFAIKSDIYNIYELGDELARMGWLTDLLQNPACIHFTLTLLQVGKEEQFLEDLEYAVQQLKKAKGKNRLGKITASTVSGLSKILPERHFKAIMDFSSRFMNSGNEPSDSAALYGISSKIRNRKNMKEMVRSMYDKMYRLR